MMVSERNKKLKNHIFLMGEAREGVGIVDIIVSCSCFRGRIDNGEEYSVRS